MNQWSAPTARDRHISSRTRARTHTGEQPAHRRHPSNTQKSSRKHAFGGVIPYYGYRYYDPLTGRWPSRDPIGPNFFTSEVNVYSFILNMTGNAIDFLGLTIITGTRDLGGNCLGGALMNASNYHMQPNHTQNPKDSFKDALEKAFQLKCKEVAKADDCMCKCKEEKILITTYKNDDPKNKGKNPFTDPKFEWGKRDPKDPNILLSDIHAIRADTGCGKDYKQIPHAQDPLPGQQGFNKNINWKLFDGKPLLCCCYEKK